LRHEIFFLRDGIGDIPRYNFSACLENVI